MCEGSSFKYMLEVQGRMSGTIRIKVSDRLW